MRRLLLLVFFVALPVDLAVVDAPLLAQAGGPPAAWDDWDDEEESAPSRGPRRAADPRHADAPPPGPRGVEPERAPQRADSPARAAVNRVVAWLAPLRLAHLPAPASASPSEDH